MAPVPCPTTADMGSFARRSISDSAYPKASARLSLHRTFSSSRGRDEDSCSSYSLKIHFLPDAISYFSRLHLLRMYPVFSFGAHLVPMDSIFAPVLFRPLLCAPASVALLVRPHKHTRRHLLSLSPPLLPLKRESPKPIQRKLSRGYAPGSCGSSWCVQKTGVESSTLFCRI